MILHSQPTITEKDYQAVGKALSSSMLGQGVTTQNFENRLSLWMNCGESSGVAVSSGSAAMVLALKSLDLGAGDEVILPTYLCRSVLEAVLTVGATPKFCDIGPHWLVTINEVLPQLTEKTKAVIVPHIYGLFAN